MIRRDMTLADGSPGWALISQVEHARISRELAEQCAGLFDDPALDAVRREAMAAIGAHDDGWSVWEEAPRLHTDTGAPVSFTELETAEALEIWTRSILRCEQLGPLAAWMVAGHFARLVEKSAESSRGGSLAAQWHADIERRREAWFAAWHARAPAVHTRQTAEEALRWLWTFDEASLWLCCSCPAEHELSPARSAHYVAGGGTSLEMTLSAPAGTGRQTAASGTAGRLATAAADPWRFRSPWIDLAAASRVVPAAHGRDAAGLFEAGRPLAIRWRLAPAG